MKESNGEKQHSVYELSSLLPYLFNSGKVKKVDKYVTKNRFLMGYLFFKKLTEAMIPGLNLSDLLI